MVAKDDRATLPVARVAAGGVGYDVVVPHHQTDYIQGNLMTTGAPYELGMLEGMGRLLSPGDLVLDVGANIGNHTLYLAHVAGCKVVAFEPNADLASAIEASARLGGISDRVDVRPCALGSERRRGRMEHLDEANLGGQTVTVDDTTGDIEIVTLDELSFDQPVRAIKIDVEGMEVEALTGGAELIMRDRPALFVEAIDGDAFDEIAAWMAAHEYCYEATYNATPTHHFRPGSAAEGVLNRRLLEVVREAYDLRDTIVELRAARDHHSARIRELIRVRDAAREKNERKLERQQARHEKRLAAMQERHEAQLVKLRRRLADERAARRQVGESRSVRAVRRAARALRRTSRRVGSGQE